MAWQVLLSTVLRGLETELNGLKADVENLKKTIKKEMSLQATRRLARDGRTAASVRPSVGPSIHPCRSVGLYACG